MDKQKKNDKKKNIISIVLVCVTVIVVVVTALSIILNKKKEEQRYTGEIVSFSFHHGSYFAGYANYNIEQKDGKVFYTAKGYNSLNFDINKEIDDVIQKYNVASWNGFNKSDDGVMDGYSFSLKVVYENGAELTASGYMKYPNNYNEATDEFSRIFEEIGE